MMLSRRRHAADPLLPTSTTSPSVERGGGSSSIGGRGGSSSSINTHRHPASKNKVVVGLLLLVALSGMVWTGFVLFGKSSASTGTSGTHTPDWKSVPVAVPTPSPSRIAVAAAASEEGQQKAHGGASRSDRGGKRRSSSSHSSNTGAPVAAVMGAEDSGRMEMDASDASDASDAVTRAAAELNQKRQDAVVQMTKNAWFAYKKVAWGANELRPVAGVGYSAKIFGSTNMGATIVDALDTLLLMGLDAEVDAARQWIESNLDFNVNADVSAFEFCIRFLGGLLGAYAMTHDQLYADKAEDLGKRLLPIFNTPTGVPKATVNLRTGKTANWGWVPENAAILSEFGTLQLEFEYLSRVTGDRTYADAVQQLAKFVTDATPDDGLFPNYLNPKTGRWVSKDVSLGALGDSFYEYLLKVWVYRGGQKDAASEQRRGSSNSKEQQAEQQAEQQWRQRQRDGMPKPNRRHFDDAMAAVQEKLVRTSPLGHMYITELNNGKPTQKMGHLACFMGGLYVLGVEGAPSEATAAQYLDNGVKLAATCHAAYQASPTKLGPEEMIFKSGSKELSSSASQNRYYILRPETVETYFYLWRHTHDVMYRDWAWEVVEALEKYAACGSHGGYCGIKDVNKVPPVLNDIQESFFLAETLKYLYLIFSDDEKLDLREWVLNTEAHAFPVV